MKKLALLTLFLSVFVWADESIYQTDFIPRTVNFLLFVALLWYLIGDKVIAFFKQRREQIAKKFQEIEEKLREVKAKKEALENQLLEAKESAKKIIEDAKIEAQVIYNKILEEGKIEIQGMERIFEDYKETEIRKAKKEVVKVFLEDIFKDIHLSSEDAAKLILKVM